MANITIYTKAYCPYCVKAKELLKRKGYADFKEINIENNDALREEMLSKSNGMKTVPQIFINGTHVGGCDNLYELDNKGKLDALLKSA